MKKSIVRVSLAVVMLGSLTFTACKKNDEAQPQPDATAVEDDNAAFAEAEDIGYIADEVLEYQSNQNMRVNAESPYFCGANVRFVPGRRKEAAVEVGLVAVPVSRDTAFIDFGAGLTCTDGKTRKGRIVVAFSSLNRQMNAVRNIQFDNYSVNNVKVEGSLNITFTSEDANTTQAVASLKLTNAAGQSVEWNSTRTRVLDTKGTDTRADDELTISGSTTGKNRKGEGFEVAITTPLLIKAACRATSGFFPVGGVLEVTPAGLSKRTVSYGAGACDRTATVTVDGRTFEVTAR